MIARATAGWESASHESVRKQPASRLHRHSSCAISDARGVFRIADLRAAAYRLEILPPDGLPFTSDPVDVRAGIG